MVDQEGYDAYSKALSALPGIVAQAVADLMAKCSSVPDGALGAVLSTEYPALAADLGDVAAAAAREFYEGQREASDVEGDYEPVLAGPVPASHALADLADALSTEAGASARDAVTANLSQAAVKTSMQRADATIVKNARRDPAHPKWALVPHVGACGYCVMLGSLGFYYNARQTVLASRHTGCTCPPVVDFDVGNPLLKGYDPAAMQEAYSKCAKAVDGDWQRRWDALGDDGRRAYAEKWHRKGKAPSMSQARDHFHQRAIVEEMNRRDREWLRTGELPEQTYSAEKPREKYGVLKRKSGRFDPRDYAKDNFENTQDQEWSDLFAHDALQEAGFPVNVFGHDDIDITIGGSWWEIKSPVRDGGSDRFVESGVRKAIRQFDKRGMHGDTRVIFNNLYTEKSDRWMEDEIRNRINQHGVSEAMLVCKDGSVVRITRDKKSGGSAY